ncbi:MAG: hypothetical protein KY475_17910 [Planctomycetes bacterium]|nr:hypothetical protein [Planctomycetota bacterium]
MIVYAIIERKSGKRADEEYGQNIGAMGLDSLDQYLREDGLTPISEFMREDTSTVEEALKIAQPAEKPALERRLNALQAKSDWHDPQEGLKTVQALIERLPDDAQHQNVAADLKVYQRILQEASHDGDPFRINVATAD